MGETRIPVVIHLARDGDAYTAALDSPDQLAFGIPGTVRVVSLAGGAGESVVVTVPLIGGRFDLLAPTDRSALVGTWTQGPGQIPVRLTRRGEATVRRRPQEPEPPFPYTSEEVTFESAAAGATLAGTVTRPPGSGPFPAAVLVSGSGQQDRDESIMGHRPFAVLADALARAGIVVLRYDDRGVGGSSPGPDLMAATTADFTDDALGAVGFLGSRADVRVVGIVGHSEGGVIAPAAAGRSDAVAFVVLLAGPAVRGDAVISHQGARMQRAAGMSAAGDVASEASVARALARVVAVPEGEPLPAGARAAALADFRAGVAALSSEDRAAVGATDSTETEAFLAQTVDNLGSPWMRHFLAYDPAPALRALGVSALALFGGLDLQVAPDQNEGPMRAALAESASPRWDVETFPGLNHLFQTATTGAVSEYAEIEETMSPAVLDRVAAWILGATQ